MSESRPGRKYQSSREEIILGVQNFARGTVGKIIREWNLPPHIDRDDLEQAGMLGATDAANRFDPTTGNTPLTFIGKRIRGAIINELKTATHSDRKMPNNAFTLISLHFTRDSDEDGLTPQEKIMDPNSVDPQQAILSEEGKKDILSAMDSLPPRMRFVAIEHWYKGVPVQDLAAKTGLTKALIFKILRDARNSLRTRLDDLNYVDENQ